MPSMDELAALVTRLEAVAVRLEGSGSGGGPVSAGVYQVPFCFCLPTFMVHFLKNFYICLFLFLSL